MEFRKFGDTYTVRMDRGEEILSTLAAFCEREDIRLAQVDALGAVDRASVAVYDVGTKTFYRRVFTEPMEITNLCGTVSRMDGRPYLHLHVTLADRELWHGADLRDIDGLEARVALDIANLQRRPDFLPE